ncbi:MAG: hypothetical protein IJ512_04670 [Ruminococcus sp.]|nr:hypothetical protein [Ruminococcus sp.]
MKKTNKIQAITCTVLAATALCGLGSMQTAASRLPVSADSSTTVLSKGRNIIVKGVLNSVFSALRSANWGLYDADGNLVTDITKYTESYTINLEDVGDSLGLNGLGADEYRPSISFADADLSKTIQASDTSLTLVGGVTVPGTLAQGEGIAVRGTVNSDSIITILTVAVYDDSGRRVTGKTVYPGKSIYDLSNLDSYVRIRNLDPGNYTYRVTASNADINGRTLTEQHFTVQASGTSSGSSNTSSGNTSDNTEASPITLTGGTVVPDSITQGRSVTVKGTVASSSGITALTVGIYSMDGTAVHGRRVYPNSYSYNLGNLDNFITFSQLEPGTYSYQVIASNADGSSQVLTSQTFTVVSSSSINSNGTHTVTSGESVSLTGGTIVPAKLTEGYGVIVRGTVKSPDSKITALTAAVFDMNGRRMTGKTIYPAAYSYDLNKLDDAVLFSDLKPGTYSYQVIAANADSNNHVLTKQSFTVKGCSGTEAEDTPPASGESITLTGGTVVPSKLTEGYGVIVRGTVKSPDSKITALTVAVFDKNGKRMTGKTIYPAAYSYDLNKLDDAVRFSDLEPGTYSYQVIAANADSNNHVLTKQSFTVKNSSNTETEDTPSASGKSVTLTGGTCVPAKISAGDGVSITGTVESSSKITALTVCVFDGNGKRITGKTIYPGAYSYDLSKLDDAVRFSDLEPGTYSYQVIAANADSNNHVLSKQGFTVKDTASSSAEPEETLPGGKSVVLTGGTSIPGKIAAGDGIAITGTVKSSSRMVALTAAVYDSDGKRITGKTVYPGAYSYDLSKLDSYVNFHKLEPGVYSYQVIAANSDSNNHILSNQSFYVTQ